MDFFRPSGTASNLCIGTSVPGFLQVGVFQVENPWKLNTDAQHRGSLIKAFSLCRHRHISKIVIMVTIAVGSVTWHHFDSANIIIDRLSAIFSLNSHIFYLDIYSRMSSEGPLWFCHEVSTSHIQGQARWLSLDIPVPFRDDTAHGQFISAMARLSAWIRSSIGSRSYLHLMSWNIRREGKPCPLPYHKSNLTITIRWKILQTTRDSLLMTTLVLEKIFRLEWMLSYVCYEWIIIEFILTLVPFFAVSLQTLMERGMRQNAQNSTRSTTGPSVISDRFPEPK